MKVIKLFLRVMFVFIILLIIAASIYVRIYGKSLLETALNDSLKRNVVLGGVSYHFPFGVQARDVVIAQSRRGGEFLTIEKIVAQVSPEAFYGKEIAFDSVVLMKPSLLIEGKKAPEVVPEQEAPRQGIVVPPEQPGIPEGVAEPPAVKTEEAKSQQVAIAIRRLVVKDGHVRYREGLTERGFSFDLEDVYLKAGKLNFPLKPLRSEFTMTGLLVKKDNPLSGSRVQAAGWADVLKKNMDAKVEVVEENGTVGLSAIAVSEDNIMNVTGEIQMQDLLKGIDQKEPSEESTVNDLVLNALSSAGVEIGVKFAFKTQMDNFRVGQVSFSGNVVTK